MFCFNVKDLTAPVRFNIYERKYEIRIKDTITCVAQANAVLQDGVENGLTIVCRLGSEPELETPIIREGARQQYSIPTLELSYASLRDILKKWRAQGLDEGKIYSRLVYEMLPWARTRLLAGERDCAATTWWEIRNTGWVTVGCGIERWMHDVSDQGLDGWFINHIPGLIAKRWKQFFAKSERRAQQFWDEQKLAEELKRKNREKAAYIAKRLKRKRNS